jgi:hypothetical protein
MPGNTKNMKAKPARNRSNSVNEWKTRMLQQSIDFRKETPFVFKDPPSAKDYQAFTMYQSYPEDLVCRYKTMRDSRLNGKAVGIPMDSQWNWGLKKNWESRKKISVRPFQ